MRKKTDKQRITYIGKWDNGHSPDDMHAIKEVLYKWGTKYLLYRYWGILTEFETDYRSPYCEGVWVLSRLKAQKWVKNKLKRNITL